MADSTVAKLEKQLSWYRSIFMDTADALFILQPQTWCVLDANNAAAELLQTALPELIGAALPQFRQVYLDVEQSVASSILRELELKTVHGAVLITEVSARLLQYDGATLLQATVRNVEVQRQLSEKLLQTDKMVLLGQLAADVAHEIRNPLAAVNLNLQLLQRKFNDDTSERAFVETALKGVERISKIVETTLNFSRPVPPQTKPEQLNALIINTLDLVASAFRRKTVSVQLDLDAQLPDVLIDAGQIQQVFVNLLTNAADAIRSKGIITIKTFTENVVEGEKNGFAVVAIQDSGAGILPDDIPRIFEPFFTRKADGTGLGLPISQRIVQQHGGHIAVESTTNIGTTFWVRLPVRL